MKVVVSNSKGLVVYDEGNGFEFSDSHVKPAIETVRHATHVLQFTGPDASSAINGQYFDISSTTAIYRVYFDVAGDEAVAADIDFTGRTAVQVALNGAVDPTAVTAKEQATAVAAALNGIAAGAVFDADETGNVAETSLGQVTVYTLVAGESASAFDAGTTASPTAVSASVVDGAGQAAITVDKRVTVIDAPTPGSNDGLISAIANLTLGNGEYAGQEKVIIFQGANAEEVVVTTASSYLTATDATLGANNLTLTAATNTACNILLVWDGAGWASAGANGDAEVAAP